MGILTRPSSLSSSSSSSSSSTSSKVRKGGGGKGAARFLATVNVFGSAGPLRFVVSEDELVGAVIRTALRSYAREGRLPLLGSHLDDFILYCADSEVLSHGEAIGSKGIRNFTLCKKQGVVYPPLGAAATGVRSPASGSPVIEKKGIGRSWKSWINKSLSFRTPSSSQ